MNRLHQAEHNLAIAANKIRTHAISDACAELEVAANLYQLIQGGTKDQPLRDLAERRRRLASRLLNGLRGEGELEFFSILDESGSPTNQQEVSTVSHVKGLPHRSVLGLLFYGNGMMLTQIRSPLVPLFPGCLTWGPCGHIGQRSKADKPQTPFRALVAETEEEISARMSRSEADLLAEDVFPYFFAQPMDDVGLLRLSLPSNRLQIVGPPEGYAGYLFLIDLGYENEEDREALLAALSNHPNDVVVNAPDGIRSVNVFTFSPAYRDRVLEVVRQAAGNTNRPWPYGTITENVERRIVIAARLNAVEVRVIDRIAAGTKGEDLISDLKWKPFDDVVADFRKNPERFSDAFVGILDDDTVVQSIRKAMS